MRYWPTTNKAASAQPAMPFMHDTDTSAGLLAVKLALIWAATVVGNVTLNQWVLIATLAYTVLQIALSLRKLARGGV